jgi:hypothetical protein
MHKHVLPHTPPDNGPVLRRMHGRQLRHGSLPSVLGDYAAELPNRILVTGGNEERGPITSPTIPAPGPTDAISLLTDIRDLLQRLPTALSDEFRTRFIMEPRESVAFNAPGGNTSVPAGTAVAICSQQVAENFSGFLTRVGVSAAPGQLPQITWQIRINGSVHPNFANRVFTSSNISNPFPFALELVQKSTVQLVAINVGPGAVDVAGVLIGWTEFLSTFKRYGASPGSGIG